MKIVVLDKLDIPENLLDRLRVLGNLSVYDDIPTKEEILVRLRDAEIAIMGWTTITDEMLENLPKLKYISLALTAYDNVDTIAARRKDILISNVPGYSRQSVAEYAFALALASMRRIINADQTVRAGNPVNPPEELLGYELYNKTLGVLGLGNIGSWVAKIGNGFGMNVLGYSRAPKNFPNVTDTNLDDLLSRSDIIIICVDINPSTKDLINHEKFQLLKRNSTVVNITSNQCVDEDALADLLNKNMIHGAAFDDISHSGYDDERKAMPSPLLTAKNVVLSPQAGWYTIDAQTRLLDIAISNVEAYVQGLPKNIIN